MTGDFRILTPHPFGMVVLVDVMPAPGYITMLLKEEAEMIKSRRQGDSSTFSGIKIKYL
jgi:hypothetical protein